MYIFKNAIRSISRSKGRNILIGIIVFVLALSTCVSLSIKESANTARENALKNLSITAEITFDRSKIMSQMQGQDGENAKENMKNMMQKSNSLTIDQLKKYATAESVNDFYYTISTSMNGGEGIEAIDSSSTDTSQNDAPTMPDDRGGGKGFMGSQGDFTIIGYSGDNAMTQFIAGTSTITDGKMFSQGTQSNECVISDELATYNSLAIGDTITLVNPNNESETVDLTIVGIYNNSSSTSTSGGNMMGFSASNDPSNQIYMSYTALKSITTTSAENATTTTDETTGIESSDSLKEQESGVYSFASADDYEKFDSQARKLGLSDDYTISSQDLNSFEQSLLPLENLSKYATYFLAVVLIVGGIILVVLNIFNVRERKYEIGVLTAIGMKKRKVAIQFVCEIFIVTFMALTVATAIGAPISVPVTNALLESQVTSQDNTNQQMEQNFGRPNEMQNDTNNSSNSDGNKQAPPNGGFMNKATNYVTQVNSATNITVIFELLGVGLILTLVSSLFAVIFVTRYDPLKILSERD